METFEKYTCLAGSRGIAEVPRETEEGYDAIWYYGGNSYFICRVSEKSFEAQACNSKP
jgi:hypothetical protein